MKRATGNSLIKRLGFLLLVVVYLAGGINHFVMPEIYWPLIPPYLIYISELNAISGLAEILLALGLIYHVTRNLACWGIALLLIAFIPAHVHFIELGSCVSDSLCFDPWVAWVRLLFIHPLLILWALSYRNYRLS